MHAELEAMAAMLPAADVAKMRKALEDTEREVTELLSVVGFGSLGKPTRKALALSHSITGNMRAELDSMSAAQRNMPALIDATLFEGPNATGWRIASRDSSTVWRVLTPDYDFSRARRSPVEVRAIAVTTARSKKCRRPWRKLARCCRRSRRRRRPSLRLSSCHRSTRAAGSTWRVPAVTPESRTRRDSSGSHPAHRQSA
jgi:hypothetical protein